MSFRDEFPDFPAADMPQAPSGFTDCSWHNDACPSFMSGDGHVRIFVDYVDPAKREFPEGPRFIVVSDEDYTAYRDCVVLVETDDWNKVLEVVS